MTSTISLLLTGVLLG